MRYLSDICQIQIQIQKVPPCIWKYTRLFGFSHTCVVFTKHFGRSLVFDKNHTCVVKNTHMKVQVISGNSHICLVFTTHIEVLQIKGIGQYIWLNLNQLLSLYTFFENFCRKYFQDVFSLTRNLPLK